MSDSKEYPKRPDQDIQIYLGVYEKTSIQFQDHCTYQKAAEGLPKSYLFYKKIYGWRVIYPKFLFFTGYLSIYNSSVIQHVHFVE